MAGYVLRALALLLGSTLVIIGMLGLFLPFLQGFLLIVLCLSVLSLVSERAANLLRGLKERLRARRQSRAQRRCRSDRRPERRSDTS